MTEVENPLRKPSQAVQINAATSLAVETALTLGWVFGLRLRQTEGLLGSMLALMGLELPVPDHTTLSRRAGTWKSPARCNDKEPVSNGPVYVLVDSTGLQIYGAGQWLKERHGAKSRREWLSYIWLSMPIAARLLLIP